MARQTKKIITKSYIHVGDYLVDTDTLNEQQRAYVATLLNQQYMNALFRGKAEFGLPELPPREEVFADILNGKCDKERREKGGKD